jgi:hypothetical protein
LDVDIFWQTIAWSALSFTSFVIFGGGKKTNTISHPCAKILEKATLDSFYIFDLVEEHFII